MNPVEKSVLRAEIRARRQSAAGPAEPDASGTPDSAGLAGVALDWLAGLGGESTKLVICAYISTGQEPPTLDLLTACTVAGYTVLVPVCETDYQLSWVRWHPGVELQKSSFAPVMEPRGPRAPFEALAPELGVAAAGSRVRAIIVPALAVDASGVRLGQGGGYYDRFLARTSGVPLAAVVYDKEYLPAGALPHDDLDMPVGYALTPTAWHPLATPHPPVDG